MYENELKEIRTRLRLSMNGVVSSSMRAHGVDYKVNFGVSLANLKELSLAYPKDAGLAGALWKTEARELKILATLLYPEDQFSPELADIWAHEVRHQEIAEQYCANLLQELPYASELAAHWIDATEEYVAVTGYILYARLFMKGILLAEAGQVRFLQSVRTALIAGVSRRQRAALLAVKRYGRQSPEQEKAVLKAISDFPGSGDTEKQEFYKDIQFEFEYYN